MLAASVYIVSEDRYVDFLPGNADQLIAILSNASEIVSFYGKSFDIPVLRQHYGLEGEIPRQGIHSDMAEIISELTGYSPKLDAAAQKYLGERSPSLPEIRQALGMEHDPVNRKDFLFKCHEDIRQTAGLWRLWKSGRLNDA